MITTLFFDFAGVIATTKLFPKLASIISRKTEIPVETIEKALYTDAERFVCGNQSTMGFWKEYLEPLGIGYSIFEFEMQNWYILRNDLLDYVDELAERGYTIHVLSDNFDVCTEVMRLDTEFIKHFKKFYFSNEVHLSKAGTDFFEYSLIDAGVSAEESLFFDDKEKNVIMAKKTGMNGLTFTDTKSFKVDLERLLEKNTPS